jgi:hypothetical protein
MAVVSCATRCDNFVAAAPLNEGSRVWAMMSATSVNSAARNLVWREPAVPMRMPEDTMGGRGSKGTRFG